MEAGPVLRTGLRETGPVMRVLITGSRAWPNARAVQFALGLLFCNEGPFTLVHGDCSTGADAAAHEWYEIAGKALGCEEIRYPASWEAYGRAAGPMRNAHMVRDGADLVLAFPLPQGSGTQGTMRLASEAGIPVRTYNTDGTVRATRWGWRLDGGHADD